MKLQTRPLVGLLLLALACGREKEPPPAVQVPESTDETPPIVRLFEPQGTTAGPKVRLTALVSDDRMLASVILEVNDNFAEELLDGERRPSLFVEKELDLREGKNVFVLLARDAAGNETQIQHALISQGTNSGGLEITRFVANPPAAEAGQKVRLEWEVTGSPERLWLSSVGDVSGRDGIDVFVSGSTSFMLHASNEEGEDSAELLLQIEGGELQVRPRSAVVEPGSELFVEVLNPPLSLSGSGIEWEDGFELPQRHWIAPPDEGFYELSASAFDGRTASIRIEVRRSAVPIEPEMLVAGWLDPLRNFAFAGERIFAANRVSGLSFDGAGNSRPEKLPPMDDLLALFERNDSIFAVASSGESFRRLAGGGSWLPVAPAREGLLAVTIRPNGSLVGIFEQEFGIAVLATASEEGWSNFGPPTAIDTWHGRKRLAATTDEVFFADGSSLRSLRKGAEVWTKDPIFCTDEVALATDDERVLAACKTSVSIFEGGSWRAQEGPSIADRIGVAALQGTRYALLDTFRHTLWLKGSDGTLVGHALPDAVHWQEPTRLAFAADGKLYLAAGGLWSFAPAGPVWRALSPDLQSATPVCGGDGRLYARTGEDGLVAFDDAGSHPIAIDDVTRIRPSRDGILAQREGNVLANVGISGMTDERTLPADPETIYDFVELADGNLLISTKERLLRSAGSKWQSVPTTDAFALLRALPDGDALGASEKLIRRIDVAALRSRPALLLEANPTSLDVDGEGRVWAAVLGRACVADEGSASCEPLPLSKRGWIISKEEGGEDVLLSSMNEIVLSRDGGRELLRLTSPTMLNGGRADLCGGWIYLLEWSGTLSRARLPL